MRGAVLDLARARLGVGNADDFDLATASLRWSEGQISIERRLYFELPKARLQFGESQSTLSRGTNFD